MTWDELLKRLSKITQNIEDYVYTFVSEGIDEEEVDKNDNNIEELEKLINIVKGNDYDNTRAETKSR